MMIKSQFNVSVDVANNGQEAVDMFKANLE